MDIHDFVGGNCWFQYFILPYFRMGVTIMEFYHDTNRNIHYPACYC